MNNPLDPNEPIDVLIPTYNSSRFLDTVLKSIKRCIRVGRIVAADHYSDDGTVEILRKHDAEILFENKSLGYARQLLISNAKTRVFMMLDDDVVLERDSWYSRALKLLGSYADDGRRIAAVALIPSVIPTVPLRKYVEFWWRVMPALEKRFFLTHATLVLRDAVNGITIPECLGAAEDVYIWLHLRARGHTTRTMRVSGIHHFSHSESKGYWMGANLRILQSLRGTEVVPFILRNVFMYPILSAIAAIFTRDKNVLIFNIRRWYGYLQGYLHPNKFWQLTRTRGEKR